jgi:hypothetical protein
VAERESNGRDEFLGRGKFGGDIMALCIMSKCRRKGGGGWFLEEKSDLYICKYANHKARREGKERGW